jgi:hypothetical protein
MEVLSAAQSQLALWPDQDLEDRTCLLGPVVFNGSYGCPMFFVLYLCFLSLLSCFWVRFVLLLCCSGWALPWTGKGDFGVFDKMAAHPKPALGASWCLWL